MTEDTQIANALDRIAHQLERQNANLELLNSYLESREVEDALNAMTDHMAVIADALAKPD